MVLHSVRQMVRYNEEEIFYIADENVAVRLEYER